MTQKLCDEIVKIQHLTTVDGTNTPGEKNKGKEVQLANADTNLRAFVDIARRGWTQAC